MYFSFCLDAKRNKKIKANVPTAGWDRFAVPTPPHVKLRTSYFSSGCVMRWFQLRFGFLAGGLA